MGQKFNNLFVVQIQEINVKSLCMSFSRQKLIKSKFLRGLKTCKFIITLPELRGPKPSQPRGPKPAQKRFGKFYVSISFNDFFMHKVTFYVSISKSRFFRLCLEFKIKLQVVFLKLFCSVISMLLCNIVLT